MHSLKLMSGIIAAAALIIVFPLHASLAADADGKSGYMMGGPYGYSSGMSQIKIADLDGDDVPEIVTIAGGFYLTILDNSGKIKTTKPLPIIPGLSIYPRGGYSSGHMMSATSFDIADLDADGVPEIATIYYGSYLVILDNEGELKNYSPITTGK